MAKAQNKSTRTPDGLLEKIKKQRKEIVVLAENGLHAIVKDKKATQGRKRISFQMKILSLEGDVKNLPQKISGDMSNVYNVLSAAYLTRAVSHSIQADKALGQGRSEESFNHFIRAERSLGAAVVLSQVGQVTTAIAKAKANLGHGETKKVRDEAIALWRKEFGPKLSAEHVAEEMVGRIRWKNGKTVTHRTLAEWIAAEKKRASSSK